MPKKRGKKYIEAAKKVEAALSSNGDAGLTPDAACKIVKETSTSKFDATIEAHIRLGVDPRHAEQMVRGSVVLPNGTGKKVRVAVFASGEKVREAQEAGADFAGGEDLVKKVSEGWTDFDAAVATPDIMSKVGPLGKILGPRGLMPNPKSGTVTFDVKAKKFLIEAKEGDVELHAEKKLVLECEDLEIKTSKTGKADIGTTFDLNISQKGGIQAGPVLNIKASKVDLNP